MLELQKQPYCYYYPGIVVILTYGLDFRWMLVSIIYYIKAHNTLFIIENGQYICKRMVQDLFKKL